MRLIYLRFPHPCVSAKKRGKLFCLTPPHLLHRAPSQVVSLVSETRTVFSSQIHSLSERIATERTVALSPFSLSFLSLSLSLASPPTFCCSLTLPALTACCPRLERSPSGLPRRLPCSSHHCRRVRRWARDCMEDDLAGKARVLGPSLPAPLAPSPIVSLSIVSDLLGWTPLTPDQFSRHHFARDNCSL